MFFSFLQDSALLANKKESAACYAFPRMVCPLYVVFFLRIQSPAAAAADSMAPARGTSMPALSPVCTAVSPCSVLLPNNGVCTPLPSGRMPSLPAKDSAGSPYTNAKGEKRCVSKATMPFSKCAGSSKVCPSCMVSTLKMRPVRCICVGTAMLNRIEQVRIALKAGPALWNPPARWR